MGAARADAPPVGEVLDLLRRELVGADPKALNEAAVSGLIDKLSGQVRRPSEPPPATAPTLADARVVENRFGYARLNGIDAESARALSTAFSRFAANGAIEGWVLDLRSAHGNDFGAVATVADLFLPPDRPILDWGTGMKTSHAKTNAPFSPLAVLVNAGTHGAADALAAALRVDGVALLFGAPTGGQAARFSTFTLSNGDRLEVAVANVKTGDGGVVPLNGLTPDIAVASPGALERRYLEDPYFTEPGTPQGTGRRLNEAELVRERRGGPPPATQTPPTGPKPVRDPVLARALDFLKGVKLLRPASP